MKPLVIGYGNPSRRDDGFGWKLAESLRQMCRGEEADIIHCQQLVPELAESISKASVVIYVDAAAIGKPGKIDVQTIRPAGQNTGNTHHFDPAALLALSATLYGVSPETVLVTVGGEDFGHGDELSTEVAIAMPASLALVLNLISVAYDKTGNHLLAT